MNAQTTTGPIPAGTVVSAHWLTRGLRVADNFTDYATVVNIVDHADGTVSVLWQLANGRTERETYDFTDKFTVV